MLTGMQVANLNAAAGQMLASGVDFTQSANVSVLQAVAGNLNTSTATGGVVILSTITGTTAGGGVVPVCSSSQTITLATGGTVSGQTSKYSPCGSGAGNAAFNTLIQNLTAGQLIYVAETYYTPQYAWVFAPTGTPSGIYVKAMF